MLNKRTSLKINVIIEPKLFLGIQSFVRSFSYHRFWFDTFWLVLLINTTIKTAALFLTSPWTL